MKPITYMHEVLPHTFNAIVKNSINDTTVNQHIKHDGNKYKVISNDNVTVVILEDGSKGIARKNPRDIFNIQVGHDIAYKRARIQSLEKEIKQISKTGKTEERLTSKK